MFNIRLSTLLLVLLPATVQLYGQAPIAFNYQGVARDGNNDPLASQTIGVRFVLTSMAGGPLISYSEEHVTTTTPLGLFSVQVGTGTVIQHSDPFATLPWDKRPFQMEVLLDPNNNGTFISAGSSPIVAVPLALSALNNWSINGNSGLDSSHFIGTTDDEPLRFKTNNIEAGFLDHQSNNIALGWNALSRPVSGTNTIAIGDSAGGQQFPQGTNNVFIGDRAGRSNTIGTKNTFIGAQAGNGDPGMSSGTFVGYQAGKMNNGANNTFIGSTAGENNGLAQGNTFIGVASGRNNDDGGFNTFLGSFSGVNNTSGLANTILGGFAGENSTDGDNNTFVGSRAGDANVSGSFNTMLGRDADVGGNNLSSATAIGHLARVDASHSMVLGSVAGVQLATQTVKVGIGTTTPQERLHLVGSLRMEDGNQATGHILVSDADGTASWIDPRNVISNNDWSLSGNFGTDPATDRIGTTDNQPLVFATNNSEQARLSTSGALGVGTASPDRHLEVEGSGEQHLRVTSTGSSEVGIELKRSGSDWRIRNQSGLLLFGQSDDNLATVNDVLRLGGGSVTPGVDNVITLGQSNRRWTSVFATSGVVNTSDARDKTNIQDIDTGLDAIMRMRPVRYEWKERPEEGEKLGLIAQELQHILPEVVEDEMYTWSEEKGSQKIPTERLGVYYSDLIPVLIRAIQEQQAQIDRLKEREE